MKKIPIGFGYERTKRMAKAIYRKVEKVICPILDDEEIHFNAIGFGHLIRKLKIRSRSEQKRRFRLIPFAKKIISESKNIEDYREKKIKKGKTVKEWAFVSTFGSLTIKLIIRQVGKGHKHFYSIMQKDTKKSP
ncbi:MAG: hypothetical protein Q8R55_04385 [Candidatus Taylorbacteria bacterium]|nr:hypothetical protein [Candidatus Taylorbacteria bacterium]